VVVDDHPLWRDALSRDLDAAGLPVVGTAGSVAQALRVVAATRPDIVVLDLSLPDGSGVEVIRALLAPGSSSGPAGSESAGSGSAGSGSAGSEFAGSGSAGSEFAGSGFAGSVLVVSASGEQADVLNAVKSGASGYLVKSARPEELVDAVRRTAAGEAVFSAGLAALVLGEMSRAAREPRQVRSAAPPLTAREVEVLRLVAKGLTARDAADRLGVSPRTVQNHVHNVLGKLQLRNRVELARYAVREGYDDPT
jgi:DNA-binding NarL/FixJ family response regulator